MPASIVEITGVGNVEFPETMTPDQVNLAAKKLYDENNAPPVKERLKAAGRYLTPFPGVVAAITEPESPLGKAAKSDMGTLLNPIPQAGQELFGAAQKGAEKLGLGKEFEAAMAIAPFHGTPGAIRNATQYARSKMPGRPAPAPQPQAPAAAVQPQPTPQVAAQPAAATATPNVGPPGGTPVVNKFNTAISPKAATAPAGDIAAQIAALEKENAALRGSAAPEQAATVKQAKVQTATVDPLTAVKDAIKKQMAGQPLTPAETATLGKYGMEQPKATAVKPATTEPPKYTFDPKTAPFLAERERTAARANMKPAEAFADLLRDKTDAQLAAMRTGEMRPKIGSPQDLLIQAELRKRDPSAGRAEFRQQIEDAKLILDDPNANPATRQMAQEMLDTAGVKYQPQVSRETRQPKVEVPPEAAAEAKPADQPQVAFMITNAQKAQLRAMGYKPEEISKMRPNEAHDILGAAQTKPPPTVEKPPKVSDADAAIQAQIAKLEEEQVGLKGQLAPETPPADISMTKTAEVPKPAAQAKPQGPLIGESSEVSHKRAAAWAQEEVAKLRDMTPEQRAAYFEQDNLRTQAIMSAEKQAAEAQVSRRQKTQSGAIQMPGLQGISSWLDRTLRPKDLMQGIIREHSGERVLTDERARWATKQEQAAWEKRPIGDSVRFWDSMENGRPQVNAADQPLADVLRRKLDQMQTDIQNLGTGKLQHWVDNYYPHLWEKQGTLAQISGKIFGKRPLAGPATGLKHRTIPTMTEGMSHRVYSQQGDFIRAFPDQATAQAAAARIPGATVHDPLKPLTYNPVDMALLRMAEMNRYIMAHKIKDAAKTEGLVQFVRFGHKPPEGWAMLDDKIFRVLQHTPQGMVVRGQYYAPKEAAKSFNNFLSPGLKGNWAHDILRSTGNTLNQAQLGLSGFHAGFTTIETGVSDLALAIQKGSRGDIVGAIKPAARALSGYSFIENPMTGGKVLKEYLQPGSRAAYARTVEAMKMAGGRPFQSPEYTNAAIKALKKGVQEGDIGKIARKMVPAFFEWQSKPIMEKLVPRQKLGVFHKMAEDVFQRADAENWPHEKIRHEMQRVWDSVDNREGQMVYDNLFWNKTMKDIGFMSVRSLGWNLGTKREFIGGALDLPKEVLRAATGRGFEVGPRVAYALALPAYVGFLGAVMTYLYTGKGPETLKDLYFIKTGKTDAFGKEERISLPSYMKDIFGLSHHPWDTLKHKIHPMISAVADMLENEDFYGTQIRDPDDLGVKQLTDVATYMGEQFLPFSVRNARQRAKQQGETDIGALYNPTHPDFAKNLGGTAQSIIGVTPAPRYGTQSAAEELAARYGGMRVPRERTQAEQARADFARTLENRQRLGKLKPDELGNALVKGQINATQIKELLTNAQTPYLLKATKRLKLDQALNVWEQASPEEKSLIKESVIKKAPLLVNYPPEKRPELQQRLQGVASHGGQQ